MITAQPRRCRVRGGPFGLAAVPGELRVRSACWGAGTARRGDHVSVGVGAVRSASCGASAVTRSPRLRTEPAPESRLLGCGRAVSPLICSTRVPERSYPIRGRGARLCRPGPSSPVLSTGRRCTGVGTGAGRWVAGLRSTAFGSPGSVFVCAVISGSRHCCRFVRGSLLIRAGG